MMTVLAEICDFAVNNWLAVTLSAALVGGWIWVCHELCVAAEPEFDLDEPATERRVWARNSRSRSVLSSQRDTRRTDSHASFRIRRS